MPNISKSRINSKITEEMRILIRKKYDNGKTVREISDELECKYTTIAAIVKKYKDTGSILSSKSACGRKQKLNHEDNERLKTLISSDVSISLKEMQNKFQENFNKTISVSTIHRAIQAFEYSFKRVQLIPERRNLSNNKEVRFNFSRKLLEIEQNKLVFLDEMGVNCSMRRRYGRAPLGQTPRKNVASIRSKNISIAAAITKTGLIAFKIRDGAFNTESFTEFINELMQLLLEKNLVGMTIICDNIPFHKSGQSNTVIKNNGHNLIFLPPYTPQLNPIEEVFGFWKEQVRGKNCDSHESLIDAINTTVCNITSNHCEAFFRHMHGFLIKGLAREDF